MHHHRRPRFCIRFREKPSTPSIYYSRRMFSLCAARPRRALARLFMFVPFVQAIFAMGSAAHSYASHRGRQRGRQSRVGDEAMKTRPGNGRSGENMAVASQKSDGPIRSAVFLLAALRRAQSALIYQSSSVFIRFCAQNATFGGANAHTHFDPSGNFLPANGWRLRKASNATHQTKRYFGRTAEATGCPFQPTKYCMSFESIE